MNDPAVDRALLKKLVAQLRFAFDRGLAAPVAEKPVMDWMRETEDLLLRAMEPIRQRRELSRAALESAVLEARRRPHPKSPRRERRGFSRPLRRVRCGCEIAARRRAGRCDRRGRCDLPVHLSHRDAAKRAADPVHLLRADGMPRQAIRDPLLPRA